MSVPSWRNCSFAANVCNISFPQQSTPTRSYQSDECPEFLILLHFYAKPQKKFHHREYVYSLLRLVRSACVAGRFKWYVRGLPILPGAGNAPSSVSSFWAGGTTLSLRKVTTRIPT